jgi:hypothetical protein
MFEGLDMVLPLSYFFGLIISINIFWNLTKNCGKNPGNNPEKKRPMLKWRKDKWKFPGF